MFCTSVLHQRCRRQRQGGRQGQVACRAQRWRTVALRSCQAANTVSYCQNESIDTIGADGADPGVLELEMHYHSRTCNRVSVPYLVGCRAPALAVLRDAAARRYPPDPALLPPLQLHPGHLHPHPLPDPHALHCRSPTPPLQHPPLALTLPLAPALPPCPLAVHHQPLLLPLPPPPPDALRTAWGPPQSTRANRQLPRHCTLPRPRPDHRALLHHACAQHPPPRCPTSHLLH